MSKFHINKHGVPAPCKATKGNCPLGGSEQHFDTQQEAQEYIDKQGEQNHGLLPNMDNSKENEKLHYDEAHKIRVDAFEKFNDYVGEVPDVPEGLDSPDELLIKYISERIKAHAGEDNKLEFIEKNMDWVEKVEENEDSYGDPGSLDFAEEDYQEDLSRAEEVNEYIESRKEQIDYVFKKVQEVDWTKYGMTQKQGEIKALRVIDEGESIFELD